MKFSKNEKKLNEKKNRLQKARFLNRCGSELNSCPQRVGTTDIDL